MKKIIAIFVFLIFCSAGASAQSEDSAFNDISKEISAVRSKLKIGTVAVIPFEAVGFSETAYGSYAADKVSAAIAKQGRLTLVEREKLSGIMKEKELSMMGLVETDDAKKIGSLLAVEAVITGRVYRTEKGADLTIKVMDSRSGKLLSVISRKYSLSSKISGKKPAPWYAGTWKVITTAPYLLEKDMRYEKLVLGDDDTFSLFLVNNDGRDVEIRGKYRVDKNSIDYQAQQMLFDGSTTAFKKLSSRLEGTIYIVDGRLYFNYTGMGQTRGARLDAMNAEYRCVAQRVK